MICAKDLGFAYGLREITFELPPMGLVMVAGPNGAGKSTLLGILACLRAPYRGSASLEGREIAHWPRRDFARTLAFVAQNLRVEFPFTAEELVLMGRAPFAQGWFESQKDHDAALAAMRTTDTLEFRNRDIRTLSGGERQRVILAAALAQEPRVLLLDEPAAFLDLRHQLDLYRLLRELSKDRLVVSVTHDLNLALQFADRLLVLQGGTLAAEGPPKDVLTPELLRDIFAVDAQQDGSWIRYQVNAR